MSLLALVSQGSGRTLRSVIVEFGEDGVTLFDNRGEVEEIAYSRLKIRDDRSGSVLVGRKWRPGYRLYLAGEAARIAKERLRPAPWPKRIWRWALQSPKAALAVLAAPYLLFDAIPAEWVAHAVPLSLTSGIEASAIQKIRLSACPDPGGNAALRALIGRVSSGRSELQVMVINEHSFMVSARPGGELLIYRSAISEVDGEVLAALVAHALAHQEAGHVRIAAARGEGSNFVDRLTFDRFDGELVKLVYSPEEEREADQAAIAALHRARISMKPAADFFAKINQADLAGRYWAQEYAEAHPGGINRAAVWATAAATQKQTRKALSEPQADNLFNICWERPADVPSKWADGRRPVGEGN